jgi:hypothetical protein
MRPLICSAAVEAIRSYTIPPETADYMVPAPGPSSQGGDVDMNLDPELMGMPQPENTLAPNQQMRSNLRLFPPPLFSRQTLPQHYKSVRLRTGQIHADIILPALNLILRQWCQRVSTKKRAKRRNG